MTTLLLNRVLHLMVPWRQSPFLMASPSPFALNSSGSPALGVQTWGWISKREARGNRGIRQRSPSHCRSLRNVIREQRCVSAREVPGARCYLNTACSTPLTCGGGCCFDTSPFCCPVPGVCTKAQTVSGWVSLAAWTPAGDSLTCIARCRPWALWLSPSLIHFLLHIENRQLQLPLFIKQILISVKWPVNSLLCFFWINEHLEETIAVRFFCRPDLTSSKDNSRLCSLSILEH